MSDAPQTASIIGDFELLERLGRGEMGEVFKAHQMSVDRMVALKVLPAHLARSPNYLERFRRETKVIGALNHPNIVHLHTAGEDRGTYYYAMEFVEGENMRDRLDRSGKLPVEEALSTTIQAVHGLLHAWDRAQIVHRDIKPANLLLGQDGVIKIADLGLAKPMAWDASVTSSSHAMGTPQYISPEQIGNEADIDFRSDIYSLGATLYHFITGKVPFTGAGVMEMMSMHLTAPIPDPRVHDPSLDPRLTDLIFRMMAKNRDDRHASYYELLQEMEEILFKPQKGWRAWLGLK